MTRDCWVYDHCISYHVKEKELKTSAIHILESVHNQYTIPDEICKKDKCEVVVTYAETVSLEKGNHSFFEIFSTSQGLFLIVAEWCGHFLVVYKKAPTIAFTRKL